MMAKASKMQENIKRIFETEFHTNIFVNEYVLYKKKAELSI